MNWKSDKKTPRGPPMNMRPTKEDTLEYLRKADYRSPKVLEVPPHHYDVMAFLSQPKIIHRFRRWRLDSG